MLAEWDDDGSGVLVRSLADLELPDGDYRVELVPRGSDQVLTSNTVLLRSADTPDQRQWALLESISYGPGLGALGTPSESDPNVRGHVVQGASSSMRKATAVPREPQWQVATGSRAKVVAAVRLTIPDAESCIHTGRHREQIETVPTDSQGRPRRAWSYGRCSGCGLERKYPTTLRRSSFGSRKIATEPVVARHDVTTLPEVPLEGSNDWATAFDALLHTGGGSWSQLERIAYQLEPTALFLDQFARTLEVLGHIDVRRSPGTLEPVAWEVAPTSLVGTADSFSSAATGQPASSSTWGVSSSQRAPAWQ